MHFSGILNGYIERLGCTAKELSGASHVSPAVISRYRSGERVPNVNGPQLAALAAGIAELSRADPKAELTDEEVLRAFTEAITGIVIGYDAFLRNLNTLIAALGISNNELARALAFDPSYISRILSGQRHPADLPQFVSVVSRYVARRNALGAHAAAIAGLVGCTAGDIGDEAACAHVIASWLGSNAGVRADGITGFLDKLDSFDLDEFARNIDLDAAAGGDPDAGACSSAGRQGAGIRVYDGIDRMRQSELDFLAAVAASPSDEDVIMYSDMPFSGMADDPSFSQAWMAGMALMLKRGLRLHVIHDVNRPFHEMMLGLERWIPLYMTGQVQPRYLSGPQNDVFCHLLRVGGTAALAGESIAGHHAGGRHLLTCGAGDVDYYRTRARDLMEHARPLMEIYRSDNADGLRRFSVEEALRPGNRRILLAGPPVCTAPPDLLQRILDGSGVSGKDADRIRAYAAFQRRLFLSMAQRGSVRLELPVISEEESRGRPILLSLAGSFHEGDVTCAYADYREHIAHTERFVAEQPSCTLELNPQTAFRNIEVSIHEGSCVIVSKGKAPAIHFVIHHPNMVAAFEGFIPPPGE